MTLAVDFRIGRTLFHHRRGRFLFHGNFAVPPFLETEILYLEDFSKNRSVLFPSALDTIAEENSSRVIQDLSFGLCPLFHSVRHFIASREPRAETLRINAYKLVQSSIDVVNDDLPSKTRTMLLFPPHTLCGVMD